MFLFASLSFNNIQMMHILRTQAYLTSTRGTSCCTLSVCECGRSVSGGLAGDGGSPHAANHPHHTRQSKQAFELLLTILSTWLAAFSDVSFHPRLPDLFKQQHKDSDAESPHSSGQRDQSSVRFIVAKHATSGPLLFAEITVVS